MELNGTKIIGNITVTGDKMSFTNCVFIGNATFSKVTGATIMNCVFRNVMTMTANDAPNESDSLPFHFLK